LSHIAAHLQFKLHTFALSSPAATKVAGTEIITTEGRNQESFMTLRVSKYELKKRRIFGGLAKLESVLVIQLVVFLGDSPCVSPTARYKKYR
jgi:hypothetical protein